MKKAKNTIACILALATLLALASCTGASAPASETPSDTPSAPSVPIEHAYTETTLPVDASGATKLNYSGGRLYFDRTSSPGGVGIVSVAPDGSDEQTAWERVYLPTEIDDSNVGSFGYTLSGFTADADGNLFIVSRFVYPDENNPNVTAYRDELIKVSPDGEELYAYDLMELPDGEPIYITSVETDVAGNAYLLDAGKACVYVFDGVSGELKFTVTEEAGTQINEMTRSNDGEIIYIAMTYRQVPDQPGAYSGAYLLKTIDFARGAASDGTTSEDPDKYFMNVFAGSGDYSFYYKPDKEILGFKLASMTDETVMSFMNSDLDPYEFGALTAGENGEFFMAKLFGNLSNGDVQKALSISRLVPNPDAALGDKTLLKLSAPYLDPLTMNAVLEFNKKSKTARIETLDYNFDTTRFDLDILSDDPPDLFSISYTYGDFNTLKYITKGVFGDLNPLLDADEDVSRDDLYANVLEASSFGGRMYFISPFFRVNTLAGKQSIFGDVSSITPGELISIADKHPDADIYSAAYSQVSGQELWMQQALTGVSRYVNVETGEVSFDSPEFIEQLQLSGRMPPAVDFSSFAIDDFEVYTRNYVDAHKEDKQLLEAVNIDSPRAARALETDLFGEPVAFVGFPSYGEGGGVIEPVALYAVSASSKHPEEAWSFIASMLAEDFEPKINAGVYYVMNHYVKREVLSLNKNVFERRAREEMIPLAERDLSDGVTVHEFLLQLVAAYIVPSLNDLDMTLPKYKNYALTEEDIARVRDAIEGASILAISDNTARNIVNEELGAFYAGAKTAEETAKIIQSRVSLYVSEQG
jgi:ABC-type glycerol-3-phosphate transport system substrate-binding protein